MAEVSRKVLAARYRLMPYLYTAFFDSNTYGCPVARPLFFGWAAGVPDEAAFVLFRLSCRLLVRLLTEVLRIASESRTVGVVI